MLRSSRRLEAHIFNLAPASSYCGFLEYLFGAPGVGRLSVTCAPMACALVNAVVSVMPVPETCAPAACARVSGAATVIVAAAETW